MNIYVGNLSYQADEQSLADLFSAYGEVRSVRVITDRETGRPRGFGFVEMDSADAGQAAISALNGKEHLGRQLNINEAQPRQERSGGGGGGFRGGDRRSFSNSRY
ncbi:RNA-binding protein [bacterium (Candidatus Blackallbacteria) CG17_big_fil_post_rev_8_21_14_2_50_48_46]|uniref:RNA-binding protein n=1 Tax=bacterium (Candidatus Blackallbacteria) CG17_big_fil_post_rev_8_21_14_2_50_48_46 TaxID=2014261 RepID=A0A2M7G1B2_9BACT|nr:MAG: RNA-binding protein [bacterium (Candidatus Blackallbacteria) CG18_big_fil_WC_8_21_14_2_50_49_26]PIW15078.1 MAG: RNA-binding protein [bacterium (Candidatus Blackallbacteria) CG17_big_fil_post_rev_8_21_14_2_50_48_46]PIW47599.1 MAG: RNA-binding protein [bacterium (Candidatus Blackallbacteria) CG13_big_fil_rev_8_21_14_2_50_49_14]